MNALQFYFYPNIAHKKLTSWMIALVTTLAILFPVNTYSHEHSQTHRRLTLAAVEFLGADFFSHACTTGTSTNCSIDGLTKTEIAKELAQGAIDEDECIALDDFGMQWNKHANWNSHFFDPTNMINEPDRITAAADIRTDCIYKESDGFNQTSAATRAGQLWEAAVAQYNARNFMPAYRLLGRVLHLLEDMTSPAHAHVDPHGHARLDNCGGDSDDFERWGFCFPPVTSINTPNQVHILDYFRFEVEPKSTDDMALLNSESDLRNITAYQQAKFQHLCNGVAPPPGITCRMWEGLTKIYNGQPQGDANSDNPVYKLGNEPNLGYSFVRHVARVAYDFTTYRVRLKDDTINTDLQADSELRRMLRGNGYYDCGAGVIDSGLCDVVGGWTISGEYQEIGRGLFQCGGGEVVTDTTEEWWLMESDCSKRISRDQACVWNFIFQRYYCTDILGPQAINNYLDGYAYIENTGGEGPAGLSRPIDNFIPLRFGCASGEGILCGDVAAATGSRSKPMFRRLYGTHINQEDVPGSHRGKTLNRIYGDVLYPTAVAYAAGLVKTFVSSLTEPTAEAGGSYTGEACEPVTFDASNSSTPNLSIDSYEWDFENDGVIDITSDLALTEYTYTAPFTGLARLKVTDNLGFTSEDTAQVTITENTSPPVITLLTATPSHLWPPNHKMIPVTLEPILQGVCATQTSCKITNVSMNQPLAKGKNHKKPDWEITDDLNILLRASDYRGNGNRDEHQPARKYDITVTCDSANGSISRDVIVNVGKQSDENNKQVNASSIKASKGGGSFGLPILLLLLGVAYKLYRNPD